MNEKSSFSISAIIACVCVAAYIAALAVAGVQIGFNIKNRRIAVEQEFSTLANRSSRISAQAFMDEAFQNTVQDTLSYSENLRGIILAGPEGEYAFERALSGAIDWVGNSPRFAKQFGTSSRVLFSPLQIEGLRNVTLSAVYRYIDFDLLLLVLKRTLIVVLIALVLAFFTLILESVTDKRHLEVPETVSRYSAPVRPEHGAAATKQAWGEKIPVQGKTRPAQEVETPVPNETPFPPEEEAPEPGDDFRFDGDSAGDSLDDIFAPDDEAVPVSDDFPDFTFGEESAAPPGEDAPDSGPALPSPAEKKAAAPGGVGREDSVERRLNAELRRSESSGQDLSVVVLEYRNPDDPEGIWFRDFARMTSDYFDSTGTVFEKGETGVTVILPGVTLIDGIKKVTEFRIRIPTTFTQGLAIGISSRLGRFVKAERILLEAAEASGKSAKDPENRIIAFKSDLDKYRAFIEKKSVQ
ncbi:MAG: hypothetical protein LBK05_07490 [Treponema sp.]|jgi:hypothetical protein|nr:hypothetical protein [Treponema sp.]